ncbi:secretion pathway protein sls2 rcy1 [Ophiostoma piceae UAMH 11346]|uniref:Secretion pathway protein sls2 rcy1 n=1 Tax=Ophiostoma piceae (strain UAMH 11346) TaxID=1262450 RepID=S3CS08_OPHP1|nr:secretion pathway protein sls2 rcy1 [Ophiostoma piceae UAMH 11346]
MSRPYAGRPGAGPGVPTKSILGVLQATPLDDTKPVLPAEILVKILDYLPVADQMRFARASRRLHEMVYDDTRWVSRLQSMGLWNEAEARRHFEGAMAKRRRDAAAAAAAASANSANAPGGSGPVGGGGIAAGRARQTSGTTTLFDASLEEERRRQQRLQQQQQQQQQQQEASELRDGFETLAITGSGDASSSTPHTRTGSQAKNPFEDPEALLNVLKSVQSVRGHARDEYGKVYGALAPFYWDLQSAKTHADPVVFKVFRDPERQANMLSNLRVFAQSDWAQGWHKREEKVLTMTNIFESAVLREFEQGYEFWDVDGRMKKYAHVLDVLDNSSAGIDLFIQKHPIFDDSDLTSMNSMDCIHLASRASTSPDSLITLDPSRAFFESLTLKVNEQSSIIGRIFPRPGRVFWALVDKVREDIIMEYITPLLDETHERNLPAYLHAVSGLFEQCLQFLKELDPPRPPGTVEEKPSAPKTMQEEAAEKTAAMIKRRSTKSSITLHLPPGKGNLEGGEDGAAGREDEHDVDAWRPKARLRKAKELAFRTFEPHLDLYLQEELDFFTKHAETEVRNWDKKLTEQDADAESFYMSNFNRQEVKKDFLSSFKKVVMMPVTVLPSLPGLGGSTSTTSSKTLGSANPVASQAGESGRGTPSTVGKLPEKAPDDELAAKAALMTSRLEGIKSLFSLEMALNLVHAAKISLGRAAVFVQLGGQAAGEAREQCESIFVVLLKILGNGHVKQGFDRAVEHLSLYNPRTVVKPKKPEPAGDGSGAADGSTEAEKSGAEGPNGPGDGGVAPLMTFIELVNVGDLISQMIDLFYEQQLAGPKIADRNDFLDPAGLAKKRFEQMIDESVAAGLNKGIDVLMDEVEYICATTQKPTDYYPEAADAVADSGLFFLNGSLSSVTGASPAGSGAGTSTPVGSALSPSVGSGSGPGQAGSGTSAFDPFAAVDIGPTQTAERVVALVRGHTNMLKGSTEKTMLDVFNGEVGLRLFTAVCKHLKRQRISIAGAVRVIADMTLYFDYIRTLRNQDLLAYFKALRELSQLYLIDARHHAKEMAIIIADNDRFGGVFRAEEVYEFAERRADWYQVKRNVERAMYGLECSIM